MAQVFVSYKHENISDDFIKHLRQKLEEAGFDVWIDSILLLPGEDWKKEIDNAIKASIALIVIMTPEARKSEYVTYEWAFAAGREIPVIPIILQKMELHPRLNDIQFVDFSNAWSDGIQINWDKIVTKLKLEVDKYKKRNNANKILPAIQRVTDEFNNPNQDTRREAMDNLSLMLPNESARQAICDALNTHLYPDVRQMAAYALAKLKQIDLFPIFEAKLNDTHYGVVQAVIYALQELGTEEAYQLVITSFNENGNRYVKHTIVDALGQFSRPESIPLLTKLLQDKELRKPATVALARIGTDECKEIIENTRYEDREGEQILYELKRFGVQGKFLSIFELPF
jgi:hypothetical protein